jgi:hyperosmotically inducible protein
MKKKNIVIRCLVLLMMIATLATFVACDSTRKQESTSQYVDDSVITAKVKTLLAEDDFLKSFQISVETNKGIVRLSGSVNSQKAVDKAGEIARGVQGVKSVNNNLIVNRKQSTRESTGQYVDDSVITAKVKTLLAEDDFLKSFQISVETNKGIVRLSGSVKSQKAVDKAGQIARGVKGVKSVKNNLIVK